MISRARTLPNLPAAYCRFVARFANGPLARPRCTDDENIVRSHFSDGSGRRQSGIDLPPPSKKCLAFTMPISGRSRIMKFDPGSSLSAPKGSGPHQ